MLASLTRPRAPPCARRGDRGREAVVVDQLRGDAEPIVERGGAYQCSARPSSERWAQNRAGVSSAATRAQATDSRPAGSNVVRRSSSLSRRHRALGRGKPRRSRACARPARPPVPTAAAARPGAAGKLRQIRRGGALRRRLARQQRGPVRPALGQRGRLRVVELAQRGDHAWPRAARGAVSLAQTPVAVAGPAGRFVFPPEEQAGSIAENSSANNGVFGTPPTFGFSSLVAAAPSGAPSAENFSR